MSRDASRQAQYLQALGVERWVARHPAPAVVSASVPAANPSDWDQVAAMDEAVKTMRWDSVSIPYSKNLRGGYWFAGSPTPRKLVSAACKTHLGADAYTPMSADEPKKSQ